MMKCPVGVVVLNHGPNELDLTRDCLRSLSTLDYRDRAIYVVDNDSESSASVLCSQFPYLNVVSARGNLGVAGGRNLGAAQALEDGAEYVLFLDNDVNVAKDLLSQLVSFAEADDAIGGVQPLIYFFDLPSTVCTFGGKYYTRVSRSSSIAGMARDKGQFTEPIEIDWISGCAGLFKRRVFDRVGWLDEAFSPYSCEDVDWGLRVRKAGFKLYGLPSAKVWHKDSPYKEKSVLKLRNLVRGHVLLIRKHVSPLNLPLSVCWFAVRWFCTYGLRYVVTGDTDRALAILQGLRDGLQQ